MVMTVDNSAVGVFHRLRDDVLHLNLVHSTMLIALVDILVVLRLNLGFLEGELERALLLLELLMQEHIEAALLLIDILLALWSLHYLLLQRVLC